MDGPGNKCLIFFVKYPVSGTVKTRLCARLGSETVVGLYKNFVLDILLTLRELDLPLRIFFYPDSAGPELARWVGEQYSYVPQRGWDLGQRMRNAFEDVFDEGFDAAILIGSDLPDLPRQFLELAADVLETHDAVIGPSSDGGYYLIGFTEEALLPEAFERISWSTDGVFDQTVSILNKGKRRTHLLPRWHDVDTFEDLKSLWLRNQKTTFSKSRTFWFLQANVAEQF
ncbi:MAG: TIGR04282 family arsenosugar biosynthesis glycosyltransferase [Planctomycetota bacterium]|jgi:rSAM/selenodomain-associated transferase 1